MPQLWGSTRGFGMPPVFVPPPPPVGGPDLPYTVANGIAAAGMTQATATALTAQDNEVTSSTGGSQQGVRITLTAPGTPTIVHNYSGGVVDVYPPGTAQINRLGASVSYTMADGSSMEFHCMSATQWYSTSP